VRCSHCGVLSLCIHDGVDVRIPGRDGERAVMRNLIFALAALASALLAAAGGRHGF